MQVSPSIFTQVFTVLGTVTRNTTGSEPEVNVLPFVYGLLLPEECRQYASVLRVITSAAAEYCIRNYQPEMIMSDFELAILNACQEVFPYVAISACFYHLCESLYPKIQELGLQTAYNDEADRTVKDFTNMIAALAFVPISDVEGYFAS